MFLTKASKGLRNFYVVLLTAEMFSKRYVKKEGFIAHDGCDEDGYDEDGYDENDYDENDYAEIALLMSVVIDKGIKSLNELNHPLSMYLSSEALETLKDARKFRIVEYRKGSNAFDGDKGCVPAYPTAINAFRRYEAGCNLKTEQERAYLATWVLESGIFEVFSEYVERPEIVELSVPHQMHKEYADLMQLSRDPGNYHTLCTDANNPLWSPPRYVQQVINTLLIASGMAGFGQLITQNVQEGGNVEQTIRNVHEQFKNMSREPLQLENFIANLYDNYLKMTRDLSKVPYDKELLEPAIFSFGIEAVLKMLERR